LGRHHLNFDQLTSPEQQLWNLFEKSDIYDFLTGKEDTVPDFESFLTFSAMPKVNIDISKIAEILVPIPPHQTHEAIQRNVSAPSSTTHNLHQRKEKINYRALHLGQEIKKDIPHAAQDVKEKCKAVRKSVQKLAKAAITKLVPGAFSPKQQTPASTPSPPHFFFFLELLALKMNRAQAVPDPELSLVDSNFVEPNKLQLLFCPSRKYVAFTHFIHIGVPFNFSQLLQTPELIFN
jgi:hypothetical protein